MKTKRAYVYLVMYGKHWESSSHSRRKALETLRHLDIKNGYRCTRIVSVAVPLPEKRSPR